jgi:hypothetical protein
MQQRIKSSMSERQSGIGQIGFATKGGSDPAGRVV